MARVRRGRALVDVRVHIADQIGDFAGLEIGHVRRRPKIVPIDDLFDRFFLEFWVTL